MTAHLFDRVVWASQNLKPVQPRYAILWEDPDEPDAPVKVTVAAPEWLAMALHGDLLPPIEAYLADQAKVDAYVAEHGSHEGFSWDQVGGAAHPYADPTGPMTEEQAMEYLIQKDIPRRVWDRPGSNRSLVAIVRRDTIPTDQTHRDAWRLTDFARAA